MTTRRFFVALLAMCLTLAGCGFQGLYETSLPGGADLGNSPYSIKIEFADVLDLVPQSAVKVNDIPVGKVDKISLVATKSGRWVALATVSVRSSVHLPANARAEIVQTSLLGEKYVSLSAPSGQPASGALRDHNYIALSRSSSAFGAEQVLGALSLLLNEGGLRQIRSIAIELNKALGTSGRQQGARDLITQLTTFTGTLNRGRNDITTALENINTLSVSLNRNKKVLTDALDTYPKALEILKNDRVKLVTLLTSLAKFGTVAKRVINASSTQLTTALKALNPVLVKLTGVGDALPGALRIAGTFPFPLGITRQLVHGDYANLDAVLNLNLDDQLCSLLNICIKGKVPVIGTLNASTAKGAKVSSVAGQPARTNKTPATNGAGATQLPTLVGAGK